MSILHEMKEKGFQIKSLGSFLYSTQKFEIFEVLTNDGTQQHCKVACWESDDGECFNTDFELDNDWHVFWAVFERSVNPSLYYGYPSPILWSGIDVGDPDQT